MNNGDRTLDVIKSGIFHVFFRENGAPRLSKSVHGASQGLLGDSPGGFFDARWLTPNGCCWPRATPTCRKAVPRCPKAHRDSILDRKLTKTRRAFGPKNDEIDAKIEPASAIKVEGGEANTTHKTKRESEASGGDTTAHDKDETKRTCNTHLTR